MSTLKTGDKIRSFTLAQIDDLVEYRSTGYRLTHSSGLEVYLISNEDPDNLFAFAFRTPPKDSTGIAHIMEHSVLCGSQQFPLKDPFVHLIKGSLNTFLNAWTFPDKTVYPASSTVRKDFFNLMRVYSDAVFQPLIPQEVFLQEGHHLDTRSEEPKITGVVFNEMKGNYSSENSVISEITTRSVFPQGPYSHDSGGDPLAIPDLTYQEFLDFHKDHYHLGNCRLFLYGNIPLEDHLDFIEKEVLSIAPGGQPAPAIGLQPRWNEGKSWEESFPASANQKASSDSSFILNWLGPDVGNMDTLIQWEILAEVLVGSAGVITRALLDSGMGQDISPVSGLESELREAVMSIGLRGVDIARHQEFERLVVDSLEKIVQDGINVELVQSIIRSFEFSQKELRGSGNGLRLVRRALRGWLHGGDPSVSLIFRDPMEALKKRLQNGEKVFEELIEQGLLRNPHRAFLRLKPDHEYSTKREAILAGSAKEKVEAWDSKQEFLHQKSMEKLRAFQSTPDDPSDIARLPELQLADIPRQVEKIGATLVPSKEGLEIVHLDEFTNGISYLTMVLELPNLSLEDLGHLQLLSNCLDNMGLGDRDYLQLNTDIQNLTGGVSFRFSFEETLDSQIRTLLIAKTKFLDQGLEEALDLFFRILLDQDFGKTDRLGEIIEELKNDFKASLVPRGHLYALSEVSSGFSRVGALSREQQGLPLWNRVKTWNKDQAGKISKYLEGLWQRVLSSSHIHASLSAEGEALKKFDQVFRQHLERLPSKPDSEKKIPSLMIPANRQMYLIPSTVGYVAAGMPGFRYTDQEYPIQSVLSHFLKTDFLWENVRMKGGAYGAFSSVHPTEGIFLLASYRDPNWKSTMEAFQAAFEWLEKGNWEDSELEKSKMGTIGNLLSPMSPGDKNHRAILHRLMGINDQLRQEYRDRLFEVTSAQIRELGAVLGARLKAEGRWSAVSSAEIRDKDLESMEDPWTSRELFDEP